MITPEKCPKCGAKPFFDSFAGREFQCLTLTIDRGHVIHEGNQCLKTQRDRLASQVTELADCLILLHAILKEWQADFPDCVGDKEPAAMATASSLIAKHKPTP